MEINSTNSPSWESNRSPPILQPNANGQVGDFGVLHGQLRDGLLAHLRAGQLTNPAVRDDMIRRKLRGGGAGEHVLAME
jgi:hypothetical protein